MSKRPWGRRGKFTVPYPPSQRCHRAAGLNLHPLRTRCSVSIGVCLPCSSLALVEHSSFDIKALMLAD